MSNPCITATGLLGYADALSTLLTHAPGMPSERCAMAMATGRVLAEEVFASSPLPTFDNAAMDGYALCSNGQTLRAGSIHVIAGTVTAGEPPPTQIGQAWSIMTGAALPAQTDTIVPIERTERLDVRHMRLREDVQPGQHLRRRGSDMQPGQRLASAGQRIDPAVSMLLAAQGVVEVSVRRQPRVAVLSTGNELVEDPHAPLLPGQIRASNGPFLVAALQEAGARVVAHHTLGDVQEVFADVLAEATVSADLVLTTGAVSAGLHDFVPAALQAAGATLLFHKTAIRPGKPLLAARLANGPLLLGLPGNPVATAVGFRFFAVPWLRARLGLPPESPLRARLSVDFQGRTGLRQFLKACVFHDADGQLQARLLVGQESFRIGTLLEANAWAVLDEDAQLIPAGTLIQVLPRGCDGRWSFSHLPA